MKQLIGSCVYHPFKNSDELEMIINTAKRISRSKFLKMCDVYDAIRVDMMRMGGDYEFYQKGEIYFYKWSATEYFYR